jgi:murein DD-endopeptidase MepM/ murein hydrolase activator NlpD
MSSFQSARRPRALPILAVLLVIILAGLAAAAWFLRPRFETDAPQIRLTPDTDVVGLAPVQIDITDKGTGLKSIAATLSVGGTEHTLASEQLAQPAAERSLTLAVAKIPGIKEGPAVLKVTARDASLWNFFKGNETTLQKNITIDVTPPTIDLVADDRYVNFGGVGVLVYKPSADAITSGVKIGNYFFPGFPGQVQGHPDYFLVMFAHPYDASADARAALVATDKAGNTRQVPVVYELKNVKYRKSTIALSENFLQGKVVPLLTDVAGRQGSLKDIFIAVNEKVRKENEDRITEITRKATPQLLWKGAFAQLSNSKVEANFADLRTYTYNGEPISTRYHLGYDLSVTKHYPVEAANSGVVAFTGDLGLYGNAVILDHGLGLFTLYGHMSAIDVKVGDRIEKRQVLGRTGETGLAAGDHLHYGVYLDGVAILPVEWWDPKWIADNIEPKLQGQGSQEIAEAQQPKGPRHGGGRRRH